MNDDAPVGERPLGRIGPFQLLELLGEGGMGSVFLAEQRHPVRRRAAVKLIKLGMDSKAVLARFAAEQQALSLMDHPNIARVLEAGITEQGQPWFAMEYVPGIPITEYSDQNRLALPERIALFQQVCAGVQHAHQKGVMHRDLKPGNVLVGMHEGRPVPRIIDFGLAKAIDHRLVAHTLFTEHGQILGTPEYMSPEQAGLSGLDTDTRTDVYSLGVLLYQLLTGELPFARNALQKAGFSEMQRLIRETEPPRPSTRVTATGPASTETAHRRRIASAELPRRLRGDLDWITMRALEKDRTRRYQTAQELAADLERHLRSEPVLAGPPSLGYRVRKFVRRHRLQVAFAATLLLALLLGIAGTVWFAVEAAAQAEAADRNARLLGEQAAEATRRRQEFDQLAGVVQLQNARERAVTLQPAWPERAAALAAWLRDDAGRLMAMRPQIAATIAELERRATPAAAPGGEPQFADASQRFLHATLTQLLAGIDDLARQQVPDVTRRRQWAERIDGWTRNHPRAKVGWAAAAAAIARADGVAASALYRDDPIPALAPQTGLVPIGRNPVTGLWEFYDLRSAWTPDGPDATDLDIPQHAADGSLPIDDDSGIVFVLIPGGRFAMGAQDEDPRAPNWDPDRGGDEGPVHEVTLAPFLLSRYELTQGQWRRLSDGQTPAMHGVGGRMEDASAFTWRHPVEQVSWHACVGLLESIGAVLPTEAQWEYACRAGTSTPWWTGASIESLAGAANVFDQTAAPVFTGGAPPAPFADGYAGPAPVGSFRPNAFGLHDVCGNVMEWCLDASGSYSAPCRAGDGLRHEPSTGDLRIIRDGCYQSPAAMARSAGRDRNSPTITFPLLGLRPARALRR